MEEIPKSSKTLACLVFVTLKFTFSRLHLAHLQFNFYLLSVSLLDFQFQSICSHWVSYCMYLCAVHCLLMDQHCNRYVIGCCLVVFAYHFLCLQVSCHFSFYSCVCVCMAGCMAVWWLPRHLVCMKCATEWRWVMYLQYTVCSTFWLAYFSEERIKREFYDEKKICVNGRKMWVFHFKCGTNIGKHSRQKIGTKRTTEKKNVQQQEIARRRLLCLLLCKLTTVLALSASYCVGQMWILCIRSPQLMWLMWATADGRIYYCFHFIYFFGCCSLSDVL